MAATLRSSASAGALVLSPDAVFAAGSIMSTIEMLRPLMDDPEDMDRVWDSLKKQLATLLE